MVAASALVRVFLVMCRSKYAQLGDSSQRLMQVPYMWPQCMFACIHARDRLHMHVYTAGEDGEHGDSSAQASVNAAELPTSDGTRESAPSASSLSATTAGPQPVPSTSNADKGQGSSTRPHLSQPQRPAASSQAGPPPTPDVAPPGPPAAADEEQPEFQPAPENWIEDAGCTRKHTHMCTWPHTCSRTWPLTCAQACSHVCMRISIGMPTHARAHVAVV